MTSIIPVVCISVLLTLLTLPAVHACLVCKATPMERILVTEIQDGEDVVLGRPSASSGKGWFRIVKVFKSKADLAPGAEIEAVLPLFSEDGGKMGGGVVLLTRSDSMADWIIRAPALFHQVVFYKKVLALPPRKAESADDQARRVAFFVDYLHHTDLVLAKAAAAEVAEASYSAMKMVKGSLDAQSIRAALKKTAIGTRRALFYTLLGLCGNSEDANGINKTLGAMWKTNAINDLAALLTAKLEIEGKAAVDEVETRYFRDRGRTLPEIEAAILALRVHGDTAQRVPRQRAIEAFRSLLVDREPLAFLLAADLARWEDWESKDRLVAIADRRGESLPEIRKEVTLYLEHYSNKQSDLRSSN